MYAYDSSYMYVSVYTCTYYATFLCTHMYTHIHVHHVHHVDTSIDIYSFSPFPPPPPSTLLPLLNYWPSACHLSSHDQCFHTSLPTSTTFAVLISLLTFFTLFSATVISGTISPLFGNAHDCLPLRK